MFLLTVYTYITLFSFTFNHSVCSIYHTVGGVYKDFIYLFIFRERGREGEREGEEHPQVASR